MSTDWSRRWARLLQETDAAAARRITQGRAYQRSGRVTELRARVGGVTGRVQGSHAKPYLVEIDIPALSDDDWGRIVEVLAGQVRHHARLLAGHAPEGLDDELSALGLRLMPTRQELHTSCTCADRVWPCEHLAAVWEEITVRLDEEPFLLLRARGRGRSRLLAELSEVRRRGFADRQPSGIDPATLDTRGWATARSRLEDLELPTDRPPSTVAGTLRMLGDPPGWEGRMSAWELFSPMIRAAAARVSGGDLLGDSAERQQEVGRP